MMCHSVVIGAKMTERIGKFKIEYCGPNPDGGPIKDQGWRVYREAWQTHRQGRPVKNKYCRWALVKVCETRDEAIEYAQHA